MLITAFSFTKPIRSVTNGGSTIEGDVTVVPNIKDKRARVRVIPSIDSWGLVIDTAPKSEQMKVENTRSDYFEVSYPSEQLRQRAIARWGDQVSYTIIPVV